MNFDDIKNTILEIPRDKPVFMYVGVGTFASSMDTDGYLEEVNNHQYPPFLQKMKNTIPDLHMIILLIDPFQENPPHIARKNNLYEKSSNNYTNQDGTLRVFVERQYVYTDVEYNKDQDKSYNIIDDLRSLNEFAIKHDASLLFHSFTGFRVASLAEYFDYEYKDYLDQIVYGMSARENHGCQFDLTAQTSFFPTRIEKKDNNARPIVKMFNYYKFIVNNKLYEADEEMRLFSEDNNSMQLIQAQKEQIIREYKERFKNQYLSILRQIHFIILNPESDKEYYNPDSSLFDVIQYFYREIYVDLLKVKEYNILYDILYEHLCNHLNIISVMSDMPFSGKEMLDFITLDEDPYKWYNALHDFL